LATGDDVWGARWCGPLVEISGRGHADLVDPSTRKTIPVPWTRAQLTPAGLVVALVDGAVQTYDLSHGLPVPPPTPVALASPVTKIVASDGGRWLAVTDAHGTQLLQ